MKMAKASEADMAMALELNRALDALCQQHLPGFPKAIERLGPDEEYEPFDRDDDAHCGRAMRHLLDILDRGSLGRVIWGMHVLLDPSNKIVDPTADTLEHHPEVKAALAARDELAVTNQLLAERERVLRAIPGCQVHGESCVPHALEWIRDTADQLQAERTRADEAVAQAREANSRLETWLRASTGAPAPEAFRVNLLRLCPSLSHQEVDYLAALAQAQAEPFGCVTVRRLSQRYENHADQFTFYPAGQSPYLDNVDECHTVYPAPQPAAQCKCQRLGDYDGYQHHPLCDASKPAAQPVAVPDGRLAALEAAVSALYFDDSSKFRSALGSVIRHLDERLAGDMLCHPKAAYDRVQAMLAAAPKV